MDLERVENSPNVVRVNLNILFKQIFRHHSIQNFCVYQGVPEEANLVSCAVADDGMIYLEFDREVPPFIKCRTINQGFSTN